MFRKEYVLKCLYPIVCMDIYNEEKWIEYWMEYYNDKIWENLENIIDVTRIIIRDREKIINSFNEREENKEHKRK